MPIFPGIFYNAILVSAVTAWLAAQIIKIIVNFVPESSGGIYLPLRKLFLQPITRDLA